MARKAGPSPSSLLVVLVATLLGPLLVVHVCHAAPGSQGHQGHRHGSLSLSQPRARRQAGAEHDGHQDQVDQVADNEAEATDEYPQQQQQQYQEQDVQDVQQAQEARHYSRRADDNFEDEQDIVYDFSYEVKDPHTGNDFGHRQSRANGLTQGQYRVLLPDGRMQVVDYVSDRDGFRPNIRYEDVGIPVFAGTEQFEQFAEGSNHFEQEAGPGSVAAASSASADVQVEQQQGQQAGQQAGQQGPSPDEVRRRRRRAAAPSSSGRHPGARARRH